MNWTASAWFVAVIVLALAGLGLGTLVVAVATALAARREARAWQSRTVEEQVRNLKAGGYVPAGTVVDGSGNVRVIREVKR